jgi:TetR/AcrR family transcriptional repressor of nem operon
MEVLLYLKRKIEMNKKRSSRDKLLDVTFDEVYKYGYCGAATANILKKAGVPRGSMYHHFESKKALVLAMIDERLSPKVREFFEFKPDVEMDSFRILEFILKKISKNKMLIKHGCPLHRLMFEMGSLDSDIAKACESEFEYLRDKLVNVLEEGIKKGEIRDVSSHEFAEFFIVSTWGMLSRTPNSSSKEKFLKESAILLELFKP